LLGIQRQGLQSGLNLVEGRLIPFRIGQFGQANRVFEVALDLAHAIDELRKLVTLAHDLLCFSGIVPELGIFGEAVELAQTAEGIVPVKDTSSAA
jgi:hypothetical protein